MASRLPDNLKLLYAEFGQDQIDAVLTGEEFMLDGIKFVCRYQPNSTRDRFFIAKPQALLDVYREHFERERPRRILELGIAEGGSCVFMALLVRPDKLVTIDLESERLVALDEFIEDRQLQDMISPFYGVDQADRSGLTSILDAEMRGKGPDLVIDDASHAYGPTRSSFEIIFPRVEAGGWYVIEDWSAAQKMRYAIERTLKDPTAPGHDGLRASLKQAMAESVAEEAAPEPPLVRFGLELALACSSQDRAIDRLMMNQYFVAVRRGPGELDREDFRLEDISKNYFGILTEPAGTGQPLR